MPKLTDEAVKALWRKQSKEMTDKDYLQWIASDLRMFEANAADAAQHRQMGTDMGEGARARLMTDHPLELLDREVPRPP